MPPVFEKLHQNEYIETTPVSEETVEAVANLARGPEPQSPQPGGEWAGLSPQYNLNYLVRCALTTANMPSAYWTLDMVDEKFKNNSIVNA